MVEQKIPDGFVFHENYLLLSISDSHKDTALSLGVSGDTDKLITAVASAMNRNTAFQEIVLQAIIVRSNLLANNKKK